MAGAGPGALQALLPAGVGHAPGSGAHTALELLMKPLGWETILLEYKFFSANYTSSALSAFVFVTLRS